MLLCNRRAFAVGPTSVRAVSGLETSPEWQRLAAMVPPQSLEALYRYDGNRSATMSISVGELLVDFSRHLVDNEILQALVEVARSRGVASEWQRMCAGEPVNATESRSVGHIALRRHADEPFLIHGRDVVPEVWATLERMNQLAVGVRQGVVTGATGRRIRSVVNIGIGGSDLGPTLLYEALRPFASPEIECRFVSNVDPSDLAWQIQGLSPEETLVVVSSKTFTTAETLANAGVARSWLRAALGDEGAAAQLLAVSANPEAVAAFGISRDQSFPMWDWVGGRFSIGSAVGLSAMIAIGPDNFRKFLDGQRLMDIHAGEVFGAMNAPLVMALIGVWNRCVLGLPTRAILPYSSDLRSLPSYLQQLIMESNGKGVHVDGSAVTHPTTPVIWGGAGTDAQHAFMQFIHQSSDVVPVDFLGFAHSLTGDDERQNMLFMNMVAQAEALAHGRPSPEMPHRAFLGNRPSTVIAAPALTPEVLGQIVALYEHAVFFEGVILGINSFDQWGVELGKDLARALLNPARSVDSGRDGQNQPGREHLLNWFQMQTDERQSSPVNFEVDR